MGHPQNPHGDPESHTTKAFRKGWCSHGIRFHSPKDECWQCRVADMKDGQCSREEMVFMVDEEPGLQVIKVNDDASPEDECWQCRVQDMKDAQRSREETIFMMDEEPDLQVIKVNDDAILPS